MKKTNSFTVVLLCLLSHTAFTANVEDTDYVQIIMYGQSLGMGWEAPRAITTDAVAGNYMLGSLPMMRSWFPGSSTLNPLIATTWESGGEQPIVSCVNVFSELYRANVKSEQKFIGMFAGEGGQTIERFSKECTNAGYYEPTFLKTVNKTLAALKTGETVSCPAIVYLQGEFNCNQADWYGGKGLTPGTDGTTDKDEYKRLLLILKNNMQADIMEKYGQKNKPLFFLYQCSGLYLKNKDIPIAMAQLEFAWENDDVVLLNPHYGLPDYNGGHLSTNGYRWFGESIGKTLYDVLVENKSYAPVYPEKFTVAGNTVTIEYHVPTPPLVLDTWTTSKASYFGFSVYNDNSITILKSIEITDGNKVLITANKDLTGKEIEVVYAGERTTGTGNLRDSYNYSSKYTYFDDSADTYKETYTPTDESGNKLYGKNYPMHNWSVGFYHKIPANQSSLFAGQAGKIAVSPNPTKGIVTIKNKKEGQTVCVYSQSGIKLAETQNNQVDISSFADGIYFVKVEETVFKVIKN